MAALAIDTQPAGPVRPVSQVSEEFVRDTLTHLRSVMLSSKEALTPKQILYDFIYFVGEPLPFAQMGFRFTYGLLENLFLLFVCWLLF